MSIKIINLTNIQAKEYFMDQTSYFNLDIPSYFNLDNVLKEADIILNKKSLNSLIRVDKNKQKLKISDFSDVNYKLLNSKNNKYSWRQLKIIHPLIYVDLVNFTTEKSNWKTIINKFSDFKSNHNIVCCLDLLLSKNNKKTNKDVTINS